MLDGPWKNSFFQFMHEFFSPIKNLHPFVFEVLSAHNFVSFFPRWWGCCKGRGAP